MSTSLAFSGGKTCCNKKAGKNVVSCKFNHTAFGTDKDIFGKLPTGNSENSPIACKCTTTDGSQCAKKPWWKFWVKNSTKKNCSCKQVVTTEAASEG